MKLYPHQASKIIPLGGQGGLAVVTALTEKTSRIPFVYQEQGNVLAVSGVPVDMQGSIREKLFSITKNEHKQAAELFKTMDGAFTGYYWDDRNKKLVIATDFLGFQPAYYALTEETFVLASEVKAIAQSGMVDVDMDLAGWGAFISAGAHAGNRTSIKGVSRLEPASIYTFDPATFEWTQETYWIWPQQQGGKEWDNFDHRQLIDLLRTNIGKYIEYGPLGTVLLSGGYDSRFILALLKSLGHDPKAFIVDHPGEHDNADGRLAVQVAKRLGTAYETGTPPDDFYSTGKYLDYLIKSEVATPSLYLFVPNVDAFLDQDFHAVWDGLALGYLLTGTHYGAPDFETYFQNNCKPIDSARWRAAGNIFSPKIIDGMFGYSQEVVDQETAKYSNDYAGVNGYAVLNWSRSRVALNPCQVYANQTLSFLPGLCREFINMIGGLPFEMRKDGKLYHQIFNQYFPHIAEIPVCSGGQFYMPSPKAVHQCQLKMIEGKDRLMSHRLTQGVLRRINQASFEWQRSRLVDRVIERVDADHPVLNNVKVRKHREWSKYSYERALLFYWQVWRWIMEGKIEKMKEELCRD